MSRVRLAEFGTSVPVELSDAERQMLERASLDWKKKLRLPSVPFVIEPGPHLAARHVTGVVRVGDLDIEIAPKFLGPDEPGASEAWRIALWRILAIVETHGEVGELTSARTAKSTGLQDLIADAFMASIGSGTARGIPRRYRESESLESVLRGTFDTGRLTQWISRPWVVPVRVDELSGDTQEARLLSWAADQLSSAVISTHRAKALQQIRTRFGPVGRKPPDVTSARRIRLGPPFHSLQRAVDISVLLLEGRGEDYGPGTSELAGFLWKSDDVYESFVFELCRRSTRGTQLHAQKRALTLGVPVVGTNRRLSTTPDVVFRNRAGTAVAVLDAKYKSFGTIPRSSDTYQVYAAAHVTGATQVGLTYPVPTDKAENASWRIESSLGAGHVDVWALPLNLMRAADDDGVQELVGVIGNWLPSD